MNVFHSSLQITIINYHLRIKFSFVLFFLSSCGCRHQDILLLSRTWWHLFVSFRPLLSNIGKKRTCISHALSCHYSPCWCQSVIFQFIVSEKNDKMNHFKKKKKLVDSQGWGIIIIYFIYMLTIILIFVVNIPPFPPLCTSSFIRCLSIQLITEEFRTASFS